MNSLIHGLEKLVKLAGVFAGYFTLLLVITIVMDVILRYTFNTTFIWVVELETYYFALIFLLGAGYAFQKDKHVRVDVFYSKFSPTKKHRTDLLGNILFLLPWTITVLLVSFQYVRFSFLINEASPQPGGLPYLFVLKSLVFFGFLVLVVQCLASSIKSILVLLNKSVE